MALASAVATLFAALFICLGPESATASGSGSIAGPGGGHAGNSHARNRSFTAVNQAEARFSCPYDSGDCALFTHLSPAVLTVPPPAAPLAADVQLPHREPPYPTGQVPRSGALARAPDLHVLQVLRT
ncbi:hypothetical protein [Streptomyces lushanensis]|uniref:hypothetical protein n=1 Tax=Streptomyces lushanensis TaxID=1434255 RepID=UPI00099F43FB|nr:hypothetical protein [Streptomyces lushanensis]